MAERRREGAAGAGQIHAHAGESLLPGSAAADLAVPGLLHLTLQRCQLLAAGARHRLGRLPPLCIFHLCRARCWCWMSPPTTWTSPPKRRWRRLCAPLRVRLLAPHQLLLPFNDVCLLCVVVLLLLLQPVCVCNAVCNTASCRPNQPPRFSVPPFRCSFSGSVIAVSHDRYFLRRIATRIVTVQGGKLVDYQGDYEVGGARGHRAVRFAHCCQRSRVCLRGWIHPADVCAPSSPGRCKPTRPARCCSSCCSSSWSRTRRRRRRWRRRRRRHGR